MREVYEENYYQGHCCMRGIVHGIYRCIFAPAKVEAASLASSAKGSETMITLDKWYKTSLPRSSESFYYFSLAKKTKVRLKAAYNAGYFEILNQNYKLVYAAHRMKR